MKSKIRSAVCLFLALLILLMPACGYIPDGERGTVKFSYMEYSRPDTKELYAFLDGVRDTIASPDSEYAEKLEALNSVNSPYWDFYTMCELADIRYTIDMSNEFYKEESAYLDGEFARFAEKIENIYTACADSEYKDSFEEDYFGIGGLDGYGSSEGGGVYDEVAVELYAQEAKIIDEYYALMLEPTLVRDGRDVPLNELLSAVPAEDEEGRYRIYNEFLEAYGDRAADIYLRLLDVREKIAQHYGYDSYAELCVTDLHGFTYEELKGYIEDIALLSGPLYDDAVNRTKELLASLEPSKNTLNAVKRIMKSVSDELSDVYAFMTKYELCDIEPSETKLQGAYTSYIDWYEAPFIVMNGTGFNEDIITLCHEFGHFAHAYYNYGYTGDTETAEFASQGLELIAAKHYEKAGIGKKQAEILREYTLLSLFEEQLYQCYITEFEIACYDLPKEERTKERLAQISLSVAKSFGMDNMGTDMRYAYIDIQHIFNSPLYCSGYIMSLDGALQLYAMEEGRDTEVYLAFITSNEYGYLNILEEVGLEAPFGKDRLEACRDLLAGSVN